MFKNLIRGAVFGGACSMSLTAWGQEVATTAATTDATLPRSEVASGLMIQARMQTQANPLSVGSGSSFLVGYRGPSYGLGLGLGMLRLGANIEGDKTSASLVFAMPTAIVDVWESADGRARANVIGGLGYGQGTVKSQYESCDVDCETVEAKQKASLIPLMLGLGGDYFLSRNFALGAEAGFQGALVFGIKSVNDGDSTKFDGGGNLQLAYGVIRATFVIGN